MLDLNRVSARAIEASTLEMGFEGSVSRDGFVLFAGCLSPPL